MLDLVITNVPEEFKDVVQAVIDEIHQSRQREYDLCKAQASEDEYAELPIVQILRAHPEAKTIHGDPLPSYVAVEALSENVDEEARREFHKLYERRLNEFKQKREADRLKELSEGKSIPQTYVHGTQVLVKGTENPDLKEGDTVYLPVKVRYAPQNGKVSLGIGSAKFKANLEEILVEPSATVEQRS